MMIARWPRIASALAMCAAYALVLAASIAPPAAAQSPEAAAPKYPPLKCRIGKPSYCFKYGGSRCLATNTLRDRDAACAAWTEACLECHRDIPECFGKVRPLSGTPKCAECEQQWHDCMHRIDARHWPERRKPSDDE